MPVNLKDFNYKFWTWYAKPSVYDQPCRRIYKGDVPILKDPETQAKKSKFQVMKTSTSSIKTTPKFATEDQQDPRPKSVRRQSVAISKDMIKSLSQQELASTKGTIETYPSNLIVTSRYTPWNFVPKNLFEQFRRLVNFYFLMVAFIQTIIDSPVHPVTAVSPLTFVICVTAIKQGYEDWLRHKNDDMVNNRPVKIVRDGKVEEAKAKDICVGDIIKLESNDQVPTDVLLLGSSDDFLRCQISTSNLDGETNLKLRYCPSGLPYYKKPEDFNNLHAVIECEHPCEDLYEFSGALLIPTEKLSEMHASSLEPMAHAEEDGKGKSQSHQDHMDILKSTGVIRQGITDFISIPLSMENLVLRGTRLKNTDFIFGIVIYTGLDTRLAKNSEKTQAKFSTVEKAVNTYLLFCVGLLTLMMIFCTGVHYAVDWYPDADDEPWYFQDDKEGENKVVGVLQTLVSFFVLFNYIIPISLYVTIELQKFMGSKFFVWDKDMMDEEGREPLCNTSDLNEELGQIEYLFSDKTGTLTQNLMQFRHCSVDAVRFEYHSDDKLYLGAAAGSSTKKLDTGPADVFKDKTVLDFFRTLSLCHSVQVVPKRKHSFEGSPESGTFPDLKMLKKDGKNNLMSNRRESLSTPQPSTSDLTTKPGTFEYQASSPDEKALLESCEKLGIVYVGEKEDVMTLNVGGQVEKFKRLMHLEFDADRKCMSVIVENSKGEMWLLTKGAESSIIPKCDSGPSVETLKHVTDFALMGLRTLVVAKKKLTAHDYKHFNTELRNARRLIKNRQEKVREVYSSIEDHMTLIGATGVEDQLQEDVPETLQAFAAAGIRVWMLTGDKLETGVNVAVSCGLITASTKQFILNRTIDPVQIKEKLEQFKRDINPSADTCLVIDGDSLGVAFKECPDILRDVSMAALRVVCCRMAPLQKAQVVQMVKNSAKKPTTCAVGDGANDCAMIQAAHIGIGILGKEGRQAARCAEFALAKFGFIRKAVLVHGHWYYVRLANLANYFFYKNILFIFPQFWFSYHSNFSTQTIFNALFLMFFNILYASCPIFFYGLTEQPYPMETLLRYPHLYKENRKNSLMSIKHFSFWVLSGVWHGTVCYYMTYFAWDNFDDMNDIASFGTVIFTGVVVTSNCKMAVETKLITFWYVGAQLYSYVTFFITTTIYSELYLEAIGFNPREFRHVFFTVLGSVNFWLLIPPMTVVAILPDITFSVVRNFWDDIVRHFKTLGKVNVQMKADVPSQPYWKFSSKIPSEFSSAKFVKYVKCRV